MARITHPRSRHPEPISAINVTPFIDVLLVLMIMIVITIPIATQKLPIDLPIGGETGIEQPHTLAIEREGALSWDGRIIRDAELPALLAAVRDTPDGTLHLQTDPEARYERFNQVLGVVKRAGVTRLGFVGNQPLAN